MSAATTGHRLAVVDRVLGGDAVSPVERRRAAFDAVGIDPTRAPLLAKVTHHAYRVVDEDVAALRAAGVAEDEIFELAIAAALGQATRQRDAASAAIDAAFAAAKAVR
jgi:hypothetical protein